MPWPIVPAPTTRILRTSIARPPGGWGRSVRGRARRRLESRGRGRSPMFACEIPVRFGDVDHARIVYYPHFFHFCHVAMEELFAKAVGVPYHEVIGRERLGYPTVHIETDFEKTVGFGETLRMEVSVLRIGKSSVDFRFEGR